MQNPEPIDQLESLLWAVSDHACRFCFGRVLERAHHNGLAMVRCSECGKHALGGVEEICSCGADCGALGHALECAKNPNICPEIPQQIMIRARCLTEDMHCVKREPVKQPQWPPHFSDRPTLIVTGKAKKKDRPSLA